MNRRHNSPINLTQNGLKPILVWFDLTKKRDTVIKHEICMFYFQLNKLYIKYKYNILNIILNFIIMFYHQI